VGVIFQEALEAAAEHSKSLKKHTSQVCRLCNVNNTCERNHVSIFSMFLWQFGITVQKLSEVPSSFLPNWSSFISANFLLNFLFLSSLLSLSH